MTALAEPLIGRKREMDLLAGLLDDTAGQACFLVVTGEPGIGKTRLLAELVHGAGRRDWLVLEGSAAEFERELPFGVVVDAFDAYLEALDPRTVDRLAVDGLDELAGVFPALHRLGTGPGGATTAAERFRAHRAVRELIERLAARQPLLVVLDDLHWADGATLELVAHLLRRPPQATVVLAGAFRSGQGDPGLVEAIERGVRDGTVERLALGPLPGDEARQLLDDLPARRRERLYRESGGNPFYLLQLARSGASPAPRHPAAAGSNGGVPPAVAAAIAAELAALSGPARGLAEAAAVAGDPFELDLAVAAAAVHEQQALAPLDELVASQLICPADVPRRFRFRHPLVRHAVYESTPPGSRLQAHRRAAEALESRGASATARAHHIEQAACAGDPRAVAILRQAGEATAQSAPASAARWFGAALRLLQDSAPPHERLELLTAFAGAAAATGRFEEARAALIDGIALLPDQAGAARVRLTVTCAHVEQLLGQHEQAHARLAAALAALPSADSADAVALQIAAAVGAYYRAEYDRVAVWGVPALETARALGDRQLTAAAAAVLAFGNAFAGEIRHASEQRDEARRLIEAMADEELVPRLDAIVHLAAAEYMLDHYRDGITHAERGLALARRTGQGELLPLLVPALTALLYSAGRLDDAAEAAEQAVDGARLTGNAAALAWGLCLQSITARLTGALDAARVAAEEGLELARRRGEPLIAAYAGSCLADALHERGNPERALEAMTSAAGGLELPHVPIGWRAHSLERMTRILLDLDRHAEADRAAAAARHVADYLELPLAGALADRAAAAVALAAGDAAAAAAGALASATTADRIGERIEAALSRLLAGRALAAIGEADRAAGEIERAAAELDACGAVRYRDQSERELASHGRRRPRRTAPGRAGTDGVAALSERELEVARLVVDRRTNKEIAAELFLGLKTVETHMRNIFRKLGVSSRVEVARTIERAERRR